MTRWWLPLALLLPVAALGAGVIGAEAGARGSTEWVVPITGYDPRDPLRGHYINFRYDWRVNGPAHLCRLGLGCQLCLEDDGKAIRVVPSGTTCPNRIDPAASRLALRYAPEFAGTPLAVTSRFYVSESEAPKLEAKLRHATKTMAIVRLTPRGRLYVSGYATIEELDRIHETSH